MTGLDKIVEQILQEAKTSADKILSDANAQSDAILTQARKDADKINKASEEKISDFKTSGQSRAKSSSDLKKRQAILKAKQEIINNIIDKAYNKLLELPDDKYFEMIEKCLEKSVQARAGEIYFSAKDAERLPGDMVGRIDKIAAAKGGSLVISKETKNIDSGFVLVYGGIEENCSFKAIFNADREKLADKVNTFLFVEK